MIAPRNFCWILPPWNCHASITIFVINRRYDRIAPGKNSLIYSQLKAIYIHVHKQWTYKALCCLHLIYLGKICMKHVAVQGLKARCLTSVQHLEGCADNVLSSSSSFCSAGMRDARQSPQNLSGFRSFLDATVNRHPMWLEQFRQTAMVQAYLSKRSKNLRFRKKTSSFLQSNSWKGNNFFANAMKEIIWNCRSWHCLTNRIDPGKQLPYQENKAFFNLGRWLLFFVLPRKLHPYSMNRLACDSSVPRKPINICLHRRENQVAVSLPYPGNQLLCSLGRPWSWRPVAL